MASTRTRELIKKDLACVLHPFGKVGAKPVHIWERGHLLADAKASSSLERLGSRGSKVIM